MPRRGLMAVPVLLASMALTAPAAFAADSLKMYRTTVDDEKVAVLGDLGVDLGETGYDRSKDRAQTIFVDLIDAQAKEARAAGLGLEEVVPGPHVTETQIAKKLAAAGSRSRTLAKPETGGDSPNQFYDVFRTYSEPGGIKDEMTSLAAQYRGLAKLVVIGQSGQGQPIVALKVTQDARNVADGARVLGDLQGHDRLALAALADHNELREAAVLRRQRGHLVLDATRLRVGAEDVVEGVRRVAARLRLLDRGGRHAVVRGEALRDLRLGHVRPRHDLIEREPVRPRGRRLLVEQVDEDRLRPVERRLVARVTEVHPQP